MDKNQALAILHEYTGRLQLSRKEHDLILQALQVIVEATNPPKVAKEEPKKETE